MDRFETREDAGRLLAEAVRGELGEATRPVVLALPRGGVPVGYEVARALGSPLDVFIVRKLGLPGHEELAMGAIATGGVRVLNDEVVDGLRIPDEVIDEVTARERVELERREELYRQGRPPLDVKDQTVVLVDDGLATGSTMLAAIRALRQMGPRTLIVAVPVAPLSTCERLAAEADGMVCLRTPEPFFGVGLWYKDFSQTRDEEVVELLERAAAELDGQKAFRRPRGIPGARRRSTPPMQSPST